MIKKMIYSSLLIIVTFRGISYSQELSAEQEDIKELKNKISRLEFENRTLINNLNKLDEKFSKQIDSLKQLIDKKSIEIDRIERHLSQKIELTDSTSTQRYSSLDESLSTKTIYWLVGFILLFIISLLVFYVLKRSIYSETSVIDRQITNTRKELEEEAIKLDNKLVELLNSQLKILESEKVKSTEEKDHSLALKVADEIIRIEKNLSNMDPNLKGHKQLAASVTRIRDNFEASGYEIVDMLNKPYDPGLKVIANFRPDETLKTGQQVISRIIKPQVNFKGIMIQSAQIEVSQGE